MTGMTRNQAPNRKGDTHESKYSSMDTPQSCYAILEAVRPDIFAAQQPDKQAAGAPAGALERP
jgi:hypothetical protein